MVPEHHLVRCILPSYAAVGDVQLGLLLPKRPVCLVFGPFYTVMSLVLDQSISVVPHVVAVYVRIVFACIVLYLCGENPAVVLVTVCYLSGPEPKFSRVSADEMIDMLSKPLACVVILGRPPQWLYPVSLVSDIFEKQSTLAVEHIKDDLSKVDLQSSIQSDFCKVLEHGPVETPIEEDNMEGNRLLRVLHVLALQIFVRSLSATVPLLHDQ